MLGKETLANIFDGSEVEIESTRRNGKERSFRISREGETILEDHSGITECAESIGL